MNLKEKADEQCPFCNSNNVYIATRMRNTKINAVHIRYKEIFYICRTCNEEWENGEMIDENLDSIKEGRKKKCME